MAVVSSNRSTTRMAIETATKETEMERQTAELSKARELQFSMLPSAEPSNHCVEVAWDMLTATEVGEDYYDFRATSEEEFLLAVGDATGHGMQAGFVVTATKSLFHTVAETSFNETLQAMSKGIRAMNFPRLGMPPMLPAELR